MREVGIGIVGCGGIARLHATAVNLIEEAELVSVCDALPGRAEAFAHEFGAESACEDVAALLVNPRVAAVLVCTPHPQHCPVAIQAASAGKHILVEKPLSVDLAQADEAIKAAKTAGVKFGVIFQRRFWPAAQRARHAIDQGKLGRVILGDCVVKWWRDKPYYDQAAWRGTWAAEGGGVLVNQAVHAIDMYQWLMGPVESVHGFWSNLSHPYVEVEDTAVAALRFRNGALGIIEATVSTKPELGSRVSIHGENGATVSVFEHPEGRVGVNDVWSIPGEETEAARLLEAEQAFGEDMFHQSSADAPTKRLSYHGLQIRDFVTAILEDRPPAVTAEEGRKSVEIITAIYQSGRTGRPVRLPL